MNTKNKVTKEIEIFKGLRIQEIQGEVLVNLEDVAIGLGFTQTKKDQTYIRWDRVNEYLTDFGIPQKLGKDDFISESVFYLLGMKGTNQKAKEFQIKVATEIIPEYRKKKSQVQNLPNFEDPAEAAIAWAQQYKKAQLAENTIKELQPKANFYDQVTESEDTVDMASAAKVLNLGIGRNKLFEFLRYKKVLQPNNIPYQSKVDAGYFRVIESKYNDSYGSVRISLKTVVFQKGLDYITRLWNKQNAAA